MLYHVEKEPYLKIRFFSFLRVEVSRGHMKFKRDVSLFVTPEDLPANCGLPQVLTGIGSVG